MIPPADISNIKSTALTDLSAPATNATSATGATVATAVNAAQGALGNITQAAVGQLFQAQVLTQLEDGSFLVNVANNPLRMALPAGTNVGNAVPMTLVATSPRPTFLLEQANDGSTPSLSDAAKVISTAIQSSQQSGLPTAIVGKAPLLPGPSENTPQIAGALQDGIEYSGVFYESHVAQWVDGDRSLADLAKEPQVQSQNLPQVSEQKAGPSGAPVVNKQQIDNSPTLLARPATSQATLSSMIDAARANTEGQGKLSQALNSLLNGRSPQEADTAVRTPSLTQNAAQTINLQLNTLEQNRIAWQGELWPGQHFEWEVSDESSRGAQTGGNENQAAWQSVVKFELPHLGKISATINLAGGHVQMRVNTASAGAASLLTSHGNELADALNEAGSPLDSLVIKQDEQS
jgi:flagellar hook-length control protein FliK